MNAISTFIRRSPAEWTKPSFGQPKPIRLSDLEPLGSDPRGRHWYVHRKDRSLGELIEQVATLDSRATLPDAVIAEDVDADGALAWRVYDCVAPGSFARIGEAPIRRVKPTPAHRPVDPVASSFLGAHKPERIHAFAPPAVSFMAAAVSTRSGTAPIIKPAEPPAAGAEEVLARLRKAGAVVTLSTDRARLVVTGEAGWPGVGVPELVALTERLLVAHLNGTPLTCEVAPHKTPAHAVTIVLGGAASCAACLNPKES